MILLITLAGPLAVTPASASIPAQFATCYDAGLLEQWRGLEGKFVAVNLSASGDVSFTVRSRTLTLHTTVRRP